MSQQFTINPEGVTTITTDGVVVQDALAKERPGYDAKPVRIAVHHDLTVQLHGARFTAAAKLSPDEALGLIMLLSHAVREHLVNRV